MGESSSIDIELIRKRLSPASNPSLVPTSCIYRVEKRIRKMNEDAYTPDTISIGPYHRDKQNSQMLAMEDLKSRYVQALLIRTSERISLEDYLKALKKLETEARGCYSELINYEENYFIELMLFDGLFILELFRKYSHDVDVEESDPIFHSNLGRTRVVRDLLLLENQIPMSVLEKLFDLSKDPKVDKKSLIELALNFFEALIPDGMYKYKKTINPPKHLLDLLSYTLGSSLPQVTKLASSTAQESLPCVMELQRSGVKFEKGSEDGSLMDIKFNEGVYEIPPLCVGGYTEAFFRNLIAYEQQGYRGRHHVTSYAILMDYLINSADDVAFLRDREIIKNQLGEDKKVLSLFNNLCTGIFADEFYYGDLCDNVHAYYNRPCNKWKADFKRDYCSSPWAIISVVAAILLLFLTICSTVLTALPFFSVKEFIHKS
ncbi:UPF0481 protein At3g47200-like [Macadamia integrifolia]|uniref:UPF0481 protein At3g47200-like n=1 Tax=Macadamia integrifolia TaxID=60698 RepID=UPI001C500D81|nr:UPF0481 protein At3g47200-like [Macadamia integrifolia]